MPRFSINDRPPNPHGGSWIFALQVLLVALVPVFDDRERVTPVEYVAILLSSQAATVFLLGYRRTAAAIAIGAAGVLGLVVATGGLAGPMRLLLWTGLVAAGITTAALSIKTAFAAGVPPVQRIFCGAASYVMLGFVFAAVHGLAGLFVPGSYVIQPGIEAAREIQWSDNLWLSFSTLTTAGFGDVAPVGALACSISTLEAIAGILFPATLIARIASLADSERRP